MTLNDVFDLKKRKSYFTFLMLRMVFQLGHATVELTFIGSLSLVQFHYQNVLTVIC